MKYSYDRALCALYPNLVWSMTDTDDLSTLQFQQGDISMIDVNALDTWINEKNTLEPLKLLRTERNKRLAECDWVAIKAFTSGESMPQEWATYMQALRDLPTNSTPTLTSTGQLDMSSVNWPQKPN